MANASVQLVITAKDEASKTIGKVGSSLAGFGKVAGTIAKTAAAAFAVAGTAATAFGISSVKAYGQYATIQKQLETVLKNTQKASKEQVKVLLDQASALEKVGVVNDDVTMSFQARLAQYDYSIDTIKKLTPAILDMMVAEKGANATVEDGLFYAEGFGKAMQGQFEILRKRGFIIDENTEKIMKHGTEAQRVEAIFKLLGKTYAGVNEEMRKTPEGAVKALSMAWDNVKKSIGFVLVEKLKLVEVLTIIAEKVTAFAESDFAAIWDRVATSITNVYNAVKLWYEETFNDTNWIWVFIKDNLITAFEELKMVVIDSWAKIRAAIEPIMPQLKEIGKILGVTLVVALMIFVKAIEYALIIVVAVVTKMIQLYSGWVQFVTKANNAIRSNFQTMVDGIKKLWQGVIDFISKPLKATVNIIESVKKKISGKKAFGGGVMAGSSYIVGEHRPEVFVPSQSGNIKQTSQVGGEINVNFNNVNVRSDYDLEMIIASVKRTLNRESVLSKAGITI